MAEDVAWVTLIGAVRSGGQPPINGHGRIPLKGRFLVPLRSYRPHLSYQSYSNLNGCLSITQFRVMKTWNGARVVLTLII